MNNNEIRIQIIEQITTNLTFDNPGGGNSIVQRITCDAIYYKRKNSTMSLPIHEFEEICALFSGKKCSTKDLRNYNPAVFDSTKKGHSCNCTFLFCVAIHLGLINGKIQGLGRVGHPFYVVFK